MLGAIILGILIILGLLFCIWSMFKLSSYISRMEEYRIKSKKKKGKK